MEKQKMRLIVASNNANKLREFREILGEQFDIVSIREAGIDADIEVHEGELCNECRQQRSHC